MEFFKLSTSKFAVFTFCFSGSSGLSFEESCSHEFKHNKKSAQRLKIRKFFKPLNFGHKTFELPLFIKTVLTCQR
jgi:hypothetical protein